jgi:hypothetical protein
MIGPLPGFPQPFMPPQLNPLLQSQYIAAQNAAFGFGSPSNDLFQAQLLN